MPSEAQLKAKIQAAIARKKQGSQPSSPIPTGVGESNQAVDETTVQPVDTQPTGHPAIYQSQTAVVVQDSSPKHDAVGSEAELIRTFSGRAVRIGVFKKQIYYSVPDIIGISNSPGKQIKYEDLLHDGDSLKIIEPLVIRMMFPSLNGGIEKLDAALADDLITIIAKLDIPFPEPIDKWLKDTSENLLNVIG